MKHKLAILAFLLAIPVSVAFAAGDLSRANIETINIEMGSSGKHMYFKPNHLNLLTGQAYKLVLTNVDKIKHELDPAEFGAKVFTRKVEVMGHDGNMIAEIKGSVREIEVGPGGEVEWFIVPVQTGKNLAMVCALKGHKEAGMVGTVTIN